MVRVSIEYQGNLRTTVSHEPSASTLSTDAPRDNYGLGEGFSPTDLLATSLGTCMITVMGIAARNQGLDVVGMKGIVEKHMSAAPPRKVARLVVDISLPKDKGEHLSEASREGLRHIGETCPVRLSLSPELEVVTTYRWEV
jgi:putative redox protein